MPTSPRTTAFFDYDGTLVEGDSILYWLRHYYARRPWMRVFQVANVVGLLLFVARLISSHTLKRIFLWPASFEHPESLDALARDFVREELAARFHGPVFARLWAHHRLGHAVVVISASGTFYLKRLAEFLPPGCVLLGTEMEWRRGPLRFPGYCGGNLRGINKILRLRDLGYGAAGRGGFAYSDHQHDTPLLEFVDYPACIRPTAQMAAAARRNGWPIWGWPQTRTTWKIKTEASCLLVLAWAPRFLAAPPEPSMPDESMIEEQMRRIGEESTAAESRSPSASSVW